MRVSAYFDLDRTQPELDFVDVDTATDATVFIDPRAIRLQQSDWARDCQNLLISFFHEVVVSISTKNEARLNTLIGQLSEPNETHLGYSKGRSRGRGLGGVGAEKVAASIASSRAAETGLLADLDDTALFIPGISSDIVSDISTHVLRGALIGYTQRACEYYRIPTEPQHSGLIWDPDKLEWTEDTIFLPRTDDGTLLLVPKSIVRLKLTLNDKKYYRGYLAPLYENKELDARSNLVTILKGGSPHVSREKLMTKYPPGKLAVIEYTQEFPEALQAYKASISHRSSPLLTHDQLAHVLDASPPDYEDLYEKMHRIPAGNGAAFLYHKAVEKLITALFYPHLGNMRREREIHDGRKRIDICYDNLSSLGTFWWLTHYKAAEIPVECKNYRSDPRNPELDQLSGRFSDRRGWVGILACRKLYDKPRFLQRCRDTATDGRGYVIPLDDQDFRTLIDERKSAAGCDAREKSTFTLIRERMDTLIS